MSQNGCIWREVVESGNLVQGLGRKPIRHFRNAKHVYVQTSSVFLICQGRKRVDILLSRCTVVLWGFVVFLLTNQYSIATFPFYFKITEPKHYESKENLCRIKRMQFSPTDFER